MSTKSASAPQTTFVDELFASADPLEGDLIPGMSQKEQREKEARDKAEMRKLLKKTNEAKPTAGPGVQRMDTSPLETEQKTAVPLLSVPVIASAPPVATAAAEKPPPAAEPKKKRRLSNSATAPVPDIAGAPENAAKRLKTAEPTKEESKQPAGSAPEIISAETLTNEQIFIMYASVESERMRVRREVLGESIDKISLDDTYNEETDDYLCRVCTVIGTVLLRIIQKQLQGGETREFEEKPSGELTWRPQQGKKWMPAWRSLIDFLKSRASKDTDKAKKDFFQCVWALRVVKWLSSSNKRSPPPSLTTEKVSLGIRGYSPKPMQDAFEGYGVTKTAVRMFKEFMEGIINDYKNDNGKYLPPGWRDAMRTGPWQNATKRWYHVRLELRAEDISQKFIAALMTAEDELGINEPSRPAKVFLPPGPGLSSSSSSSVGPGAPGEYKGGKALSDQEAEPSGKDEKAKPRPQPKNAPPRRPFQKPSEDTPKFAVSLKDVDADIAQWAQQIIKEELKEPTEKLTNLAILLSASIRAFAERSSLVYCPRVEKGVYISGVSLQPATVIACLYQPWKPLSKDSEWEAMPIGETEDATQDPVFSMKMAKFTTAFVYWAMVKEPRAKTKESLTGDQKTAHYAMWEHRSEDERKLILDKAPAVFTNKYHLLVRVTLRHSGVYRPLWFTLRDPAEWLMVLLPIFADPDNPLRQKIEPYESEPTEEEYQTFWALPMQRRLDRITDIFRQTAKTAPKYLRDVQIIARDARLEQIVRRHPDIAAVAGRVWPLVANPAGLLQKLYKFLQSKAKEKQQRAATAEERNEIRDMVNQGGFDVMTHTAGEHDIDAQCTVAARLCMMAYTTKESPWALADAVHLQLLLVLYLLAVPTGLPVSVLRSGVSNYNDPEAEKKGKQLRLLYDLSPDSASQWFDDIVGAAKPKPVKPAVAAMSPVKAASPKKEQPKSSSSSSSSSDIKAAILAAKEHKPKPEKKSSVKKGFFDDSDEEEAREEQTGATERRPELPIFGADYPVDVKPTPDSNDHETRLPRAVALRETFFGSEDMKMFRSAGRSMCAMFGTIDNWNSVKEEVDIETAWIFIIETFTHRCILHWSDRSVYVQQYEREMESWQKELSATAFKQKQLELKQTFDKAEKKWQALKGEDVRLTLIALRAVMAGSEFKASAESSVAGALQRWQDKYTTLAAAKSPNLFKLRFAFSDEVIDACYPLPNLQPNPASWTRSSARTIACDLREAGLFGFLSLDVDDKFQQVLPPRLSTLELQRTLPRFYTDVAAARLATLVESWALAFVNDVTKDDKKEQRALAPFTAEKWKELIITDWEDWRHDILRWLQCEYWASVKDGVDLLRHLQLLTAASIADVELDLAKEQQSVAFSELEAAHREAAALAAAGKFIQDSKLHQEYTAAKEKLTKADTDLTAMAAHAVSVFERLVSSEQHHNDLLRRFLIDSKQRLIAKLQTQLQLYLFSDDDGVLSARTFTAITSAVIDYEVKAAAADSPLGAVKSREWQPIQVRSNRLASWWNAGGIVAKVKDSKTPESFTADVKESVDQLYTSLEAYTAPKSAEEKDVQAFNALRKTNSPKREDLLRLIETLLPIYRRRCIQTWRLFKVSGLANLRPVHIGDGDAGRDVWPHLLQLRGIAPGHWQQWRSQRSSAELKQASWDQLPRACANILPDPMVSAFHGEDVNITDRATVYHVEKEEKTQTRIQRDKLFRPLQLVDASGSEIKQEVSVQDIPNEYEDEGGADEDEENTAPNEEEEEDESGSDSDVEMVEVKKPRSVYLSTEAGAKDKEDDEEEEQDIKKFGGEGVKGSDSEESEDENETRLDLKGQLDRVRRRINKRLKKLGERREEDSKATPAARGDIQRRIGNLQTQIGNLELKKGKLKAAIAARTAEESDEGDADDDAAMEPEGEEPTGGRFSGRSSFHALINNLEDEYKDDAADEAVD